MRGMYGIYDHFPGVSGGFPWSMAVSWILGLAVIAALVFFAVRAFRVKSEPSPKYDEALSLLARRLVMGEIDEDEYARLKKLVEMN